MHRRFNIRSEQHLYRATQKPSQGPPKNCLKSTSPIQTYPRRLCNHTRIAWLPHSTADLSGAGSSHPCDHLPLSLVTRQQAQSSRHPRRSQQGIKADPNPTLELVRLLSPFVPEYMTDMNRRGNPILPPSPPHPTPTSLLARAGPAPLDDPPCMAIIPVSSPGGAGKGARAAIQFHAGGVRGIEVDGQQWGQLSC